MRFMELEYKMYMLMTNILPLLLWKPLHPSRLLEEKFWIHVESGFPLSGIGMKDMMERRTFNWSRQKDPYYNDIMGQILEDQKRMISL